MAQPILTNGELHKIRRISTQIGGAFRAETLDAELSGRATGRASAPVAPSTNQPAPPVR